MWTSILLVQSVVWTNLFLALSTPVASFTLRSPPSSHFLRGGTVLFGSSLCDRLKSSDRFERWRFLQDLLEDFLPDDDDAHRVLYAVLDGYPLNSPSADLESGALPTATPEQREIVAQLLQANRSTQSIPALTDAPTLRQVERLIPDPSEDDDGFKSAWDVVLELHGRESVKINQEAGTERWKALSIVARVLIHYEFLTEGIPVREIEQQV